MSHFLMPQLFKFNINFNMNNHVLLLRIFMNIFPLIHGWASLLPPDFHYSWSCCHLTDPAVLATHSAWACWGLKFISSDNILTFTEVPLFIHCHSFVMLCASEACVLWCSHRSSVTEVCLQLRHLLWYTCVSDKWLPFFGFAEFWGNKIFVLY